MTEVEYVAGRVASLGLPAAVRARTPMEVPDAAWPGFLRYVTRQRITGLAMAASREASLVLSESQRDELVDRHRAAMAMVLLLEQLLREVAPALAEAGIPTIVLKGAAVANTFYPHPAWRTYGDLDLLSAAPQWRRTCEVLSELGFRRLIPEPRPGFDVRFGKGASFEDARGLQVDLHRTLAQGPFGLWIDPRVLVKSTTDFEFKGMPLHRLDDTHTLIHACIHAALGRKEPLLVPLRDVLQIGWSGRADWDLLAQRSREWRLNAPIAHAFRTAVERLGAQLPEEAAELLTAPVPRKERRALAAYTTERARRGGSSVAALWAIPGIKGRARYVRAMLLPDQRFLDARDRRGWGTLWRRWRIPLRWAVGRIRSLGAFRARPPGPPRS